MQDNLLYKPGHTACAGCGQAIASRLVIEAAGPNTIVTNNTGCLEVFTTRFPESAWNVPWIHSLFENAAAVASGIESALKYLGKKDSINVIAQAGDGGTADIGLQALSGMLERGHDILYVCLPPETELILGDGSIVEIGNFVDNLIDQNRLLTEKLFIHCDKIVRQASLLCPEGVYGSTDLIIPVKEIEESKPKTVEVVPAAGTVLSWKNAQFLPMNVICAQRKTSDETLIKVSTSSGQTLSLTGEHRVLIDTPDGPKWQRADLLKVKDEVYAPRKISVDIKKEFYIVDFLDKNIKVRLPLEIKDKINQKLRENYGNIKKAAKILGLKYWHLTEKKRMIDLWALKRICAEGSILTWEEVRENLVCFGIEGGRPVNIKEKKLTPDLLYLLGLISSDGSIGDKSHAVTFINKEEALIKDFKRKYRKLFSGRRISEIKDKEGISCLVISEPIFSSLAKRLQIKFDPKELIKLPEELISAFLRGYFDGDGYCGITKSKHSYDCRVILSTVNEKLAKRLRQMLQRIGIACFQGCRKGRFDLNISSKEDIEIFLDKVFTGHPLQKQQMKKIRQIWKKRKERGKYFSIAPKICGKILKEICDKQAIPVTILDKKRNICTLAAGTRRATKARIAGYKEDLARIISEEKDDSLHRETKGLFEKLELCLRSDFYLDPIQKTEVILCKSKFVYDITVEDTHLFAPEAAFIISNCYDNEAYMNTGIQRSGLTPYDTNTTTSPPGSKSSGNIRPKKPMPEIAMAHGIPYVATSSAGFPQDIQRKVKKALSIKGPKYMQIHVPCPLGWRHETNLTVEVAKLAVETGLYPLVEYENGALTAKRQIMPKPVEEYLKVQGRFKHLLKNPEELKKVQEVADNNIKKYGLKAEAAASS